MFSHICNYLLAKVGPRIEHRHDDPAELKALVRARIEYLLDEPHNFYQSFKREIFALNRSQQLVRGSERVAHQNSKRRRAIQENEIECLISVQRFERLPQAGEMIWHARDFHFGAGHIEIGRHDEQSIAPSRQNLFGN